MNQSSKSRLLHLGSLFRFVGYGLLILSFFNLVDSFAPPLRLMDPVWQFQTLGKLVELVPIPLLGLVLIFYDAQNQPATLAKWERSFLNILSWAALLVGIGYFLLFPLGVSSTWWIHSYNDYEFKQKIDRVMTQVEPLKKELKEVNTEAEMEDLLNRIEGLPPEIKESKQLKESKQKLTNFINEITEKPTKKLKQTQFDKQSQLLRQSVRWNLGSLVSGVLFIGIWLMTEWARLDLFRSFADDD